MATPAESRPRGTFQASVLSNRQICLDHYLLVLEAAGFPPSRPGQFVNVRCGAGGPVPGAVEADWPAGAMPNLSGDELLSRRPLLRRPFSLAGRRDRDGGAAELDVIHHVVGAGTSWMAGLSAGDAVGLTGPLGNGFTILPDRPAAALVGGGVGMPPLLYLAEALGAAGKEVVAFAAARTARLLPLSIDPAEAPSRSGRPTMCIREFAARGAASVVATDDGSLGVAALAHEAFAAYLDHRGNDGDLAVYACGPEPMLKAVAEICQRRQMPCQLALERHMACGMGTCQGCVVKVRDGSSPGWRYKLACTDGPVFEAAELVWE